MRILYAAGNRIGANSQLCRFVDAAAPQHEIKKAAYLQASGSIPHIDWTLDALHHNIITNKCSKELLNLFGHSGVPMVNIYSVTTFFKEVEEFEPEVVISDGEPIAAHIAKSLNIKLWYCSPIHLLDGVRWDKGQLRYTTFLNKMRQNLIRFPEPDRAFVYSPFGDIKFRPFLNSGFEWITPYYLKSELGNNNCLAVINDYNRFSELSKILNGAANDITLYSPYKEEFSNMKTGLIGDLKKHLEKNSYQSIFTTGETSYIADAFYSGCNICVSPTLGDVETLLNAILVKEYKLGTDIHQVEFMESYALDEVEKALNKEPETNYWSLQNRPFLHEALVELKKQ